MFGFTRRPQVVCADGFTISVQASSSHYCDPRDGSGPYEAVEVGFPSASEPLLMDYIEISGEDPTQSVYPYVPVGVIETIIANHGGIHPVKMANVTWQQPGLPHPALDL